MPCLVCPPTAHRPGTTSPPAEIDTIPNPALANNGLLHNHVTIHCHCHHQFTQLLLSHALCTSLRLFTLSAIPCSQSTERKHNGTWQLLLCPNLALHSLPLPSAATSCTKSYHAPCSSSHFLSRLTILGYKRTEYHTVDPIHKLAHILKITHSQSSLLSLVTTHHSKTLPVPPGANLQQTQCTPHIASTSPRHLCRHLNSPSYSSFLNPIPLFLLLLLLLLLELSVLHF